MRSSGSALYDATIRAKDYNKQTSGIDDFEQLAGKIQRCWLRRLYGRRQQRIEVAKQVVKLQASRNLINDHIVEDRKLDICYDLSRMTLDSAVSAFNAQAAHRKTGLMRGLGGATQLLLGALEGITRLGGHESRATLSYAVQVLFTDIFHCSSVAVYRIVDSPKPGGGRAFEIGNELQVPLQALPLAAKLLSATRTATAMPPAASAASSVACTTVETKELSELRVCSWLEPADSAALGKPDVLVASGQQGEGVMQKVLEEGRRLDYLARPAAKEDACHVSALRIGGMGADDGRTEALVLMSRIDGPLSPDELYVAAWLGTHIGNAIKDFETRLALRKARQAKALLIEGVNQMAKGDKGVEAFARSILKSDDAVLYLVSTQPDGRPQLVPVSREVRAEEREGIYETCEHLSTTGKVLNVRQGNAGALERQLELQPKPLRGGARSMLCVPVVVPAHSNSCLAEGVTAVMQWRNAADGSFTQGDVRLALEWASLASPALQLAATQNQRLLLEERVLLASAKRDALLASAKILGSTRDVETLFSSIMSHAKSLMEVERSTMFLIDRRRKVLCTMVADGLSVGEITVPWDKGLAGACFQSKQVVNIRDAYDDPRFNKAVDVQTGFRTRSVLCYPVLNAAEEVIGVVQLINKVGESSALRFTENDEDLLAAFAGQIGMFVLLVSNSCCKLADA